MPRGFVRPLLLAVLALLIAGAIAATTYYGLQAFADRSVDKDRVDYVLIAGDGFPPDDEALLAALRAGEPRPTSVNADRVSFDELVDRQPEAFAKLREWSGSDGLQGLILRLEGTAFAVAVATVSTHDLLRELGYHGWMQHTERDPRSQAEWEAYKQRIASESGELFYLANEYPDDELGLREVLVEIEGLELLGLERISPRAAVERNKGFAGAPENPACSGRNCVAIVVGFRVNGHHGDFDLPSTLRAQGYGMVAYGYSRVDTVMRD